MIIAKEKEIFNAIAKHIVTSELDDKWDYTLLKMIVIGNTVDFNLNFHYKDNDAKNTKLSGAFKCSMRVLELHKLTNQHPNYKKWNKFEFTLYSNSKSKIEYIWDKELQEEVDSYSQIKSA